MRALLCLSVACVTANLPAQEEMVSAQDAAPVPSMAKPYTLSELADKMCNVTNALSNTAGRPPLARWGQEILDYVSEHRTEEEAMDSRPAYLISNYLFWCWEMDPTEERTLIAAMKRSPNASIRTLAAARERLGMLRTEPWQLSFTAVDGREVNIAKLKGKVILVDGWSIWCSTCLEAFPEIKRLREKYRDQGFEVVGICFAPKAERDEIKSLQVIKEKEVTWPICMLKNAAAQDFMDRYGINAFPATWLFNREGRLISSRGLHGKLMEQEVRKALGLEL